MYYFNHTSHNAEAYDDFYFQSNRDYCLYYCNNYVEVNCMHDDLPKHGYQDYWTHIELGAGNYGVDGHTKTSQTMTVLMDLKFVSNKPNYIDKLPVMDNICYDPNHQYKVLFDTLDLLIQQKGNKGIFHVNDLFPQYAEYAYTQLKKYAEQKNYNEVIIEAISGDYDKIQAKDTLGKYGKFLYDSAHLKNPEVSFFNYKMDGDQLFASDQSRNNARVKLQKLADLTHDGLYFFPINHPNFIPKEEIHEFITKGIFYEIPKEVKPVPYHFPEGPIITKQRGAVLFISTSYKCGSI